MNVLLVSREFPPFRGGGIGTYTEHAASALADAGHTPVVLTVSHDGTSSTAPHAADPRVLVHRLPLVLGDDWSRPAPAVDNPVTRAMFAQLGPWSVLSRAVALAIPGIVRAHDIHVVEAPECGAILWWTLNDRRIGRPGPARADGRSPLYVVHIHSPNQWIDIENRQAPPRRASIELRNAERESARLADLVICPSHDLASWVRTRWRIPRVDVLPYPLGRIRTLPGPARSCDGPVRALLVGRLEPRKGVDILLRALVIAVRRGVDAHVLLAGQDTTDPRTGAPFGHRSIHTIVPQDMRHRVRALGKLGPEQLASARAEANLAAVPGAFDNFPYAAIESMALALPVVAPRYGGISEIVRDHTDGFLFNPHDPADLARAIGRYDAISPGARAAMGASALSRVASFCDNTAAIEARDRLFRAALERSTLDRARTLIPDPRAACIGVPSPDLVRIVAEGRAPFAVGWSSTTSGDTHTGLGLSPASASLRSPDPSLALCSHLREQLLSRAGPTDPVDILASLIADGHEGAVDPSVTIEADHAFPPDQTRPSHSPLLLHPDAFNTLAPIHMARRAHPFPWPVVPVAPSTPTGTAPSPAPPLDSV